MAIPCGSRGHINFLTLGVRKITVDAATHIDLH